MPRWLQLYRQPPQWPGRVKRLNEQYRSAWTRWRFGKHLGRGASSIQSAQPSGAVMKCRGHQTWLVGRDLADGTLMSKPQRNTVLPNTRGSSQTKCQTPTTKTSKISAAARTKMTALPCACLPVGRAEGLNPPLAVVMDEPGLDSL